MLKCSKEKRNGGMRNTKLQGDGISNPVDLLTIIDGHDELADGEEIICIIVPIGFQIQMSPPSALDVSLKNPGILGRFGLRWFAAVITCQAQKKQNSLVHDYRVILDVDEITRSITFCF